MDTRVARGAVGGSAMGVGDWRAQQQADSRDRITDQILDTLKKHLSFSGDEELQELNKLAERVEQEIYTAATSQHEYSRKICFMMLAMETRLQNPKSDTMRSNSAALYDILNTSLPDALADGGDWQEEVYQKIIAMKDPYLQDSTSRSPIGEDWLEKAYKKIKALKDLYLLDLNDMHQKTVAKLQEHDSLSQQPETAQLEKLKLINSMLERYMKFLQTSKHEILANYKDKLDIYERQIIYVVSSFRRKLAAPQSQTQALIPPIMESLQHSQQTQSHENQMNSQGSVAPILESNKMPTQQQAMPHMQSQSGQSQQQQQVDMRQMLATACDFQNQNVIDMQKPLCPQKRAMPEASSTSLDSTSQTGNPSGGDWQEEVYQKIKAMKDLYLLELNEMHQKLLSKLQKHNSLPQQSKNAQLEKMEVFKNMLERYMQFLQIPKHGILASHTNKLGTYESQIISIINANRRKPAPPQQQA